MRKFISTIVAIFVLITFSFTVTACTERTSTDEGDKPNDNYVAVTSVILNETILSLDIGEVITLKATVLPENATDKSVLWSSSNPAVATVKDGKIIAVGAGNSVITVTTVDQNQTAVCNVSVVNKSEGLVYYENGDGTVSVMGYTGSNQDIIIPEFYNNKIVTSVYLFEGASTNLIKTLSLSKYISQIWLEIKNIDSIIIDPENPYFVFEDSILYNKEKTSIEYITHIDEREEFTISDSITRIPSFEGAKELKRIIIGEGISIIDQRQFADCVQLSNVQLGENIETISYNAFSGCINLNTVNLPRSLKTIDSGAFRDCKSLKSIYIPISVNTISSQSFEGCDSLTIYTEYIDIPIGWDKAWNYSNCEVVWGENNITTDSAFDYVIIGDSAIISRYKSSETDVVVPDYIDGYPIVSIGTVFAENTSIRSVVLNDFIEELEQNAFYRCSMLQSIELNSKLKSIGDYCFSRAALESIVIPNSVIEIGISAFEYCSNMSDIEIGKGVKTIGWNAFIYTGLKDVVIPDNVTTMTDFYCSSNLRSIVIGKGITEIGSHDFYLCSGLEKVVFRGDIVKIGESAFQGCNLKDFTLPDTLELIGNSAFENCTELNSISIPNNVTKIENYVFADCRNLEKVVLGTGTEEIGYHAFYNCSSLETIIIPSSVQMIDDYIFENCLALNSIYCEASTKPEGWKGGWANYCDAQIYWGNAWHYVNGVPTLII